MLLASNNQYSKSDLQEIPKVQNYKGIFPNIVHISVLSWFGFGFFLQD